MMRPQEKSRPRGTNGIGSTFCHALATKVSAVIDLRKASNSTRKAFSIQGLAVDERSL